MKATKTPRAAQSPSPQPAAVVAPAARLNVQLTVDERDVIDAAKARLGRFVELLRAIQHARECEHYFGEECLELDDVIHLMDQDIAALDETFEAADARVTEKGGGVRWAR